MLAIAAGGVAGLFALAGGLILMRRRLFDPRIFKTSSFADIAILALLLAQLALGLSTIPISARHLDGGEMVRFMTWADGVFTFRPDNAAILYDASPVFKVHIVLGLTIFLVFPFTRLVHMLSAPIWYLNRRGWQLVRTRRPLKGAARANSAR
jgi:nitrate reductase gamma subunit